MSITTMASNNLLNRMRETVKDYVFAQNFESASFWAEKVLHISKSPEDAYEFARCLYNLKEYQRAAYAIKNRKFDETDLSCLYIAALCHFMAKDFKEADKLLESKLVEQNQARRHGKDPNRWLSLIFLLKGKLLECSDSRLEAAECFEKALKYDILCVEAFDSLTGHHMLTSEEETNLIEKLNCSQTDCDIGDLAKLFYGLQRMKYHKPGQLTIPAKWSFMAKNVDVEAALAERYYFNSDYHMASEMCEKILARDKHHRGCLPIYILSLMETDQPTKLFDVAHQLVDAYPESALAWFAVGCYYIMIKKVEPARRYLSKATSLDNVFAFAWLVYGHSFAIEREHDQAMSAFFRAYHLMRGNHLPLLFIGVEYGRANDYKLAESFLLEAKMLAQDDPLVLHEYGVVLYKKRDYTKALEYFESAEHILIETRKKSHSFCDSGNQLKRKWEPLFNNIGHTLRQLERYDEAINYHNKALSLVQDEASTYSALGFLCFLKEDYNSAVNHLIYALAIRSNDAVATTLHKQVLPKFMEKHENEKQEQQTSLRDKSKLQTSDNHSMKRRNKS